MPILKRSEVDMLRFSTFTDVLINPTNCVGQFGTGLSKAFADKWSGMALQYHKLCDDKQISIGQLHIYYDKQTKNTIINMAVKQDWRDSTNVDDVAKCYIRLAEYLKQHPFYTVAMPALGSGTGRLDPILAEDVVMQYLDPLPNIIHLSMRPDRFERPPRYLAIVGSRKFKSYEKIAQGVDDGLRNFGLTYSDFDGIVSGGAMGVDAVGCGTGKPQDLDPNLASQHKVRALICQANWERYGNSAGFLRNRTVSDIATHAVAFIGSKSVGTKGFVDLINRYNANIDKLILLAEEKPIDEWSGFDRPIVSIPERKRLFVIDISAHCE